MLWREFHSGENAMRKNSAVPSYLAILAPLLLTTLMALAACTTMSFEDDGRRHVLRIHDRLVLDISGCELTRWVEQMGPYRSEGMEHIKLGAGCDSSYSELLASCPIRSGEAFNSKEALLSHLENLDTARRSSREIVNPLETIITPGGLTVYRRLAHYTRSSTCVTLNQGHRNRIYGELIIFPHSLSTVYVYYGQRIITLRFTYTYDPEEFRGVKDEAPVWEAQFMKNRAKSDAIISRIKILP